MMGAAATALIAAAPTLHAGVPAEQATTLQVAVRNILSVPKGAAVEREAIAARLAAAVSANTISIDNSDDITVGADATALGHATDRG